MDTSTDGVLIKVLTAEELKEVSKNVRKKIETYFEGKFEAFLTAKALGEAAKNNIDAVRDEFEKKVEELSSKIQDYEAKLQTSQQNVDELRVQLDSSREEITKLLETTKRYELEAAESRRERNEAIDERDSLLKRLERKNAESEHLLEDIKVREAQLQAAIAAKCDALSKIDEIQSKEVSLDFKEKRMSHEHALLTSQIQSLTEDLNRNTNELQTLRRDNTIRHLELETKLTEKTEELKIANSTNSHLNETVTSLTAKAESLAAKLFAQSEESAKMMEYYKKELHAKTKLAELYNEDKNDKVHQVNELTAALTDLKKLLNEATDQYGQLETKSKAEEARHDQELDDKNSTIQALRDELKNANDLLKEAQEESLESAVEKLAPTAAVTTRLIKSDMTLTELYSLYVRATEDLQLKDKENRRLNLQMKSILEEVEEKAPIIKKQSLDYQRMIERSDDLNNQLKHLIAEKVEVRDELQEAVNKNSSLERENKQLKIGQNDLARQVCYLLKEIEQGRGGFASENEQSISSDMSANEVISKKLVTFSDITELQENNQRLLLLVRDLSKQLEDTEEMQNNMTSASYEAKIAAYTKRLQDLQESQESQTQMMTICMQQRDRYKKSYLECLKNTGKNIQLNIDSSLNNDQMEVGGEDDVTPFASNSSVISTDAVAGKDKRIIELEDKIKLLIEQLKTTKEEYDEYRKEKLTNEKMMNEQFDAMRTELRELTSSNCKLMSTVEYNNEQIKIQQKNAATYKKQISALEERNKNYDSTIIKHEQTITYLREELMRSQQKLGSTEVQMENLKQECRHLKNSESRLQLEREALHRERQTQGLLLNNLEMIKASFERSETEGRMRLEVRLDDSTRECSALRRRLQEEQDRFRELTVDLKRQTETAKARMEEEVAVAEKLRQEVVKMRDEICQKTKQIDDLSKKLQESMTPSKNDNPIAQANKKAREYELKSDELRLEVESLTKELQTAREHAQQYCKMSQRTELELKELHDTYSEYKTQSEQELAKLRASEVSLKSRVDELDTEIQLQITGAQINTGNSTAQVNKVQTDLKEALQKISENNRELRDLREQCNTLTSSLQIVEQKYANEMILHSTDIQELAKMKEDLSRVRDTIEEMRCAKEKAIEMLDERKKGWEESEIKLREEKDELEKRVLDLDAQNSKLHDQIQLLSSKLSLAEPTAVVAASSTDDSMNESGVDRSLLNRSINEEDVKGYDQLLQIIKYLRKEKDIAVAKVDILKTENVRLMSEFHMLQKKLDETSETLTKERTKSETVIVTTAKHEEILRKVETLNAITDSNRILREERDALNKRVAELSERVNKVEDELFPLQEKNRELATKIEETTSENTSLRTEAVRWRQRANLLIERSNKNPEDFKRLQNERESLAKMLTSEKEALKHAQEEFAAIKTEKARLDTEILNLSRQVSTLTDDKKKVLDELNSMKQHNARYAHDIMELKNLLLIKDEKVRKAEEELSSKDAQLVDSKNKEIQIRKIAKRYKDSYFELKNKEGIKDGNDGGGDDSQTGGEGTSKQDSDKELKDKVNELNAQIATAQEESDTLRKENETLRSNIEKEDRNKNLLKEAKTRIMYLTDYKNSVIRELNTTKAQLQILEQNRDEHDLTVNNITTQYETRISRLEKELSDQDKEMKETITRLTRENEQLMLRINQLHRQLGMPQSAKPSTSSGSGSEKGSTEAPRTANVKPMSGPSGQQSATVTPWRGGETPLASIRPMSVQNRTAAVLPTSQTSNVATIQGSPSSGSVTALVPPQQQVHTTGNSSGEAMSSSPTSSHTDYMPATSSAAVVVATIPPMGANAESSQEAESVPTQNNESTTSTSSTSQVLVSGGQQQQAVALVSPRVEGISQNIVPPQSAQAQETNQPSTSGTSSTSNVSVSNHHQASSSNTVTTTQAGHKRPRDIEGDSSTSTEEPSEKTQPQSKRTRMQTGEATFQGVSESGLDVEYQVPTSSQRDQEDDIIIVDSDDGMADEGNADVDDGPMEDEADNGEGYEMEEAYEQEQEIDEGEGPDIDEDHVQSDNNEVEVDDSSEVPNQSGTTTTTTTSSTNHVAPDAGTSQVVDQSSGEQVGDAQGQEIQQIQTISSGSEAGSSSQTTTWRQLTPLSRQQQATYLMLQQGYEETGDDSIVPSTPTLYVPRRVDGFSEAVSSPHPQVPHAARFTFSESTAGARSAVGSNTGAAGEDAQIDLSEEASGGRSVPSTPQQTSPPRESSAAVVEGSSTSTEKTDQAGAVQEPVAGPSHLEGTVPEVTVTTAVEDTDAAEESATTSDVHDGEQSKMEEDDVEEEEGIDGVTSEGEKVVASAADDVTEEGREAEATTSPTVNTRSRSIRSIQRGGRSNSHRGGPQRGGRPTPIIWQDHNRGGGNRNINPLAIRGSNEPGSPSRGAFQNQRGQRTRRMRRPSGQGFGGNMRY